MINGLDLFSGIGGLTLALAPWVKPIAYCENDRYAQSVLLSSMARGYLPMAPIWDDVRTLRASSFSETKIDIVYGGFPCQDISIAGLGAGLEGERSVLFWEIVRMCSEFIRRGSEQKPPFIFLENVPAITTRGGNEVVAAITEMGYDCRWCTISASEVGANHKRERWFLLAYSRYRHEGRNDIRSERQKPKPEDATKLCENISNTDSAGCEKFNITSEPEEQGHLTGSYDQIWSKTWWSAEPNVGRVVNGVPNRVDRIKGLGNAVVPLQAREAFKTLIKS